MSLDKKYRRGIRHSFLGLLGVSGLQFLQMLVFARWAGPSALGDFALAAAVMGFLAPLAEAGISQAVIQANSWRGEQLATLAWASWGLGLLILILLWLVSPWISDWYNRPDLTGLLPVMALPLLITPFAAAQGGLLVRDFRFDLSAKIEVGSFLISFLVLVLLLFLGWGVWAMALSFVARNIAAALACWYLSKNMYPVNWLRPGRLREVWPMLRFGSLDLSARWADYLANYLDKLIVGKWLGAEALGFYHIAFSLCVLPTARLGYVVTRVSYPVFAKLRAEAAQLQRHFQQAAQDLVLILFPVYLGMALFSNELVALLYGGKWLPAAPLLLAFSIAGLVRSLSAVFPQLTKGIGRPELTTAWMVLWTIALTLFLTVFLWRELTVNSAAWSRVAATFSLELGLLFMVAHWCRVDFKPVLRYAAQFLSFCLPIVLLASLAGLATRDFPWQYIVKFSIFTGGLTWLIVRSKWKNDFRRMFELFLKT